LSNCPGSVGGEERVLIPARCVENLDSGIDVPD
jgi:hypothetical protein